VKERLGLLAARAVCNVNRFTKISRFPLSSCMCDGPLFLELGESEAVRWQTNFLLAMSFARK